MLNDPLLVDLVKIQRRPVLIRKEHAQAFVLVQGDHALKCDDLSGQKTNKQTNKQTSKQNNG